MGMNFLQCTLIGFVINNQNKQSHTLAVLMDSLANLRV